MKRLKQWMALLFLLSGAVACDDFARVPGEEKMGQLRWVMDHRAMTKAAEEIPDTNDFLLTVKDAKGSILYDGPYGDSPDPLPVTEGSYTVSVVSVPFTSPAFERPQYGDTQVVYVAEGQVVTIKLGCTLQNCGIRLRTAPDFLETFPNGVLYASQGDVKLAYMYMEDRIAYMFPGDVSVLLYDKGVFESLFTRNISPREILTLKISAPGKEGHGTNSVNISVDTTKVWSRESFVIGEDNQQGNGGTSPQDAISVGEASSHIGEEGLWVHGYIVGGDLTSTGASVKTSGITKATHLAIADRSSVTAKESCVAVELPSGKVRDALNLVDHPGLIGTRVYVKGNIVDKYFGTTGLKGTSDYQLKD